MKVKLMLVDDANFIRDSLRQAIQDEKHLEIVAEAQNGQEAVDLALKTSPDIIIMDLIMPVKSGIEATKEIKKSLKNTYIIACSSSDQKILKSQALEAGCCDYIAKPFEIKKILDTINKYSKES